MPKLNTYDINANPTGAERVLGYDPNNDDLTEVYTLQDIANLAAGNAGLKFNQLLSNSFTGPDWASVNSHSAPSTNVDTGGFITVDNTAEATKTLRLHINIMWWWKRQANNGGAEIALRDVFGNTDLIKIVGGSGAANIDVLEDKWKQFNFVYYDSIGPGVRKDYRVRIQSIEQDMFMTNPWIQAMINKE